MWTLSYRPEVQGDLVSGVDWYNTKHDGLGDEFLIEYLKALDEVMSRPLSFAIASNGLRPCLLKRFPYIIHFRASEPNILIVSVMGSARDESAFQDRT